MAYRDASGRRKILKTLAASGLAALAPPGLLVGGATATRTIRSSKTFHVWVFSDAHVGRDQQYGKGLESLATALRQSESASGFDWDIALDLGDLCGDVRLPGDWEGMRRDSTGEWKSRYHGYFPQGTPKGASFLYWVDSKQDSGTFESFLSANPRHVDLCLGGHTHTAPDDTYGGKSHIERRWGTTFINVAGLTRYMGDPQNCIPRSWLLTFVEGSNQVTAQCYLHSNDYAPARVVHQVRSLDPTFPAIYVQGRFRMNAGKPTRWIADYLSYTSARAQLIAKLTSSYRRARSPSRFSCL